MVTCIYSVVCFYGEYMWLSTNSNWTITIKKDWFFSVLALSSVTDAQCSDGVELTVNGTLISNGTTLYRPVGDRVVVRCRRCNRRPPPNWFNSDGNRLPEQCNDTVMICAKTNEGYQDLVISSLSNTLAQTYSCSRNHNGTIIITVLG